MNDKKVIVLILSYNGKHLLDDSVSSYLNNDYGNCEVVVIDNGSTDGTKEYVEKKWPQVTVLRTEINLKYSGGFNFGLDYAFNKKNADYVLITNNDVKADKYVISSCVETALSNDKIAFVTGKVYYFDQPDIFQTVGKKYDPVHWFGGHIGRKEKDIGQFDKTTELAWCDDIFWLVSKRVYIEVGGYDTEFAFQSEDSDWQVRAKKAGYKIFFTPNAKIWHKESMTIGKTSAFKAYYDNRNPLILHLKYRTSEEFRFEFRKQINFLLKMTLKNLIKFRFFYIVRSWQGLFSALLWGIRNKKITFKSI
jgi:GT2 family glycosyltransferase